MLARAKIRVNERRRKPVLIEKGADKIIKVLRVLIPDRPGALGRILCTIGEQGAHIGDILRVRFGITHNVRDIEVYLESEDHLERVLAAIGTLEGVIIEEMYDPVLSMHKGGKIKVMSKIVVDGIANLRKVYTPGVAKVCREIAREPHNFEIYTWTQNTVAIVTNGTAVLGLGDIGVRASLPVMEGKAVLLEQLVGLSGIPILIPHKDPDMFVNAVLAIHESFGAINLEDIAAPACFEIEDRLIASGIEKPVMHDDQHGTGVVVLASLLNASKYAGVSLKNETIGLIGLGAAGMGIAKLLHAYGVKRIIGCDLSSQAMELFERTIQGSTANLEELMRSAKIIISTTGQKGLIKPGMVQPGQVILALSNPDPEIRPEDATSAGARFAADGRSVNNAVAYPAIYKGALAARARRIGNRMKIEAAKTIASFAEEGEILPSVLNKAMHEATARTIERTAYESGLARVIKEES
jgi:malate dehydrogenase (oxaloacetate-decarboxylating)